MILGFVPSFLGLIFPVCEGELLACPGVELLGQQNCDLFTFFLNSEFALFNC